MEITVQKTVAGRHDPSRPIILEETVLLLHLEKRKRYRNGLQKWTFLIIVYDCG